MSEAERKDSTEYKDENEHKHSAESQGEGEHSEAEHSEAQHGEAEHGDVVHELEFPQEYLGVLEEQIELLQKRLEVCGLRENLRRRFLQKLDSGKRLLGMSQDEARLEMVLIAEEIYLRYSVEQWEELGWWERAKAGDPDACEMVHAAYNPRVLNSIRKYHIWILEDLEDISQNIWLKVYRGLSKFDGEELGQYIEWLSTITEREAINWIRKNPKEKQAIPVSQMQVEDDEAAGSMSVMLDNLTEKNRPKPAISPEVQPAIKYAVEKLPAQGRRIWDLHYDGYPVWKIAKVVGLSKYAVTKVIEQVQEKLQKQLQVLNPGKGGQK